VRVCACVRARAFLRRNLPHKALWNPGFQVTDKFSAGCALQYLPQPVACCCPKPFEPSQHWHTCFAWNCEGSRLYRLNRIRSCYTRKRVIRPRVFL